LIACDPGLKPGWVELDGATGRVVRASHKREEWVDGVGTPWDIAVTELQWHHERPAGPKGKAPPPITALLTLAFRAGFTLASIPAWRRMALPPAVWRGVGNNASKEQVQARIARDLTPAERKLFADIPKARHGDVLDSIGIGRAALALATTTTKHDWKIT
jgi:hypothetical protein